MDVLLTAYTDDAVRCRWLWLLDATLPARAPRCNRRHEHTGAVVSRVELEGDEPYGAVMGCICARASHLNSCGWVASDQVTRVTYRSVLRDLSAKREIDINMLKPCRAQKSENKKAERRTVTG